MSRIRFKDIGNSDLQPTGFYIKKFTPNFYMGMHSHEYFELMYANKGGFIIEMLREGLTPADHISPEDVTDIPVHQGELIFIDSTLFHRLTIKEDEVVIYNLELQPINDKTGAPPTLKANRIFPVNYGTLIEQTGLKSLANSKNGYTVLPNLSEIDSTFRKTISSLLKTNMGMEDWLCSRLQISLLFMEIAKSLTLLEQNNTHYVKKVYLYIKHHLHQKITLDDIAAEVGYHKTYIASQFKKYTGKTIVQTINSMRISKGLRLLRDTSYSIGEISKLIGFPSYAQMVHEFNKTLGMSPTAARKLFLDDEVDHDNPQYQSIAIRISEEDMSMDEEEFKSAYYKKDLPSKVKDLINKY